MRILSGGLAEHLPLSCADLGRRGGARSSRLLRRDAFDAPLRVLLDEGEFRHVAVLLTHYRRAPPSGNLDVPAHGDLSLRREEALPDLLCTAPLCSRFDRPRELGREDVAADLSAVAVAARGLEGV